MILNSAGCASKGTLLKQFDKIAIFIDGANLYTAVKSLGFEVDYKRLLNEFRSRGSLLRAFYYTAVYEDNEHPSLQPLLDWLDYNGYTVVTKAAKEFVDQTGRRKIKGNIDVELAIDALEIAPHIDQMVLLSGDGDFRSLVEVMQRHGIRVIVVSSIPTVAQELRRQADEFIDINELRDKIGRDPAARPPRSSSELRAPIEQRHTQQPLRNRGIRIGAGKDDWDEEE
jgi:uncharacterized LabA/DUF88 family protein